MLVKILRAVLACAFFIAGCCSCTDGGKTVNVNTRTELPQISGEFYITALNVGKADAFILRTKTHTVLIDTGNRGDGKKILSCLAEHGITQVDHMIITHFDKDHVGGAVRLMNNIPIANITVPDYEGNNEAYQRFTEALSKNSLQQTVSKEKQEFVLDDVRFLLYPALKKTYAETDNDFSAVVSIQHGENSFLFTGDAEAERLAELPRQMEMKHTFLKVPHHGAVEKNSAEFIKSVSPQYAVITDSAEEPCDARILDMLESGGCKVYRTSQGEIGFTSDGKSIMAELR